MPSVSKAQQRMMAEDLAKARAGQPTRTGMTIKQLEEYTSTPTHDLPERTKPKKGPKK